MVKLFFAIGIMSLNASLGEKLNFFAGEPLEILKKLVKTSKIEAIYWNRCYEPWQIKKQDASPFKVFTPFYKKGCLLSEPPRLPLDLAPTPTYIKCNDSLDLEALRLLPKIAWYKKLEPHWNVSESGAHKRFQAFKKEGLDKYAKKAETSQLKLLYLGFLLTYILAKYLFTLYGTLCKI